MFFLFKIYQSRLSTIKDNTIFMITNCNTALLSPYAPTSENPWDLKKISHLYKRAAYGISPDSAALLLNGNPSNIIDTIIDEAIALPVLPAPSWADNFDPEMNTVVEERREWRRFIMGTMVQNGFRDRMAFFWSNHFVTGIQVYACSAYMYRYTQKLREHALGNFKTFVYDIGLESAMLLYLNGRQNRKNRPNENYSRELFELFTLGEGNGYGQTDIVDAARALTGYNARDTRCSLVYFNENSFDNGEKTIFGQTGNWGYTDLIDILFEQRAEEVSKYIVEKLYVYLVSPDLPTDPTIISELALTFRSNDFELAPVLRQLLKSEHFFSQDTMNVIIKSPVDLFLSFFNDAQLPLPDDAYLNSIVGWSRVVNQYVLTPPNVAGWQRDKDWISSPTMIGRWKYIERIINDRFQSDPERFRALAISLAGQSNDVVSISKSIVDWFLPDGMLSEADYLIALEVFKSDSVPDTYFEDGTWDLEYITVPKQVCLLLAHISKQPEFQLK